MDFLVESDAASIAYYGITGRDDATVARFWVDRDYVWWRSCGAALVLRDAETGAVLGTGEGPSMSFGVEWPSGDFRCRGEVAVHLPGGVPSGLVMAEVYNLSEVGEADEVLAITPPFYLADDFAVPPDERDEPQGSWPEIDANPLVGAFDSIGRAGFGVASVMLLSAGIYAGWPLLGAARRSLSNLTDDETRPSAPARRSFWTTTSKVSWDRTRACISR